MIQPACRQTTALLTAWLTALLTCPRVKVHKVPSVQRLKLPLPLPLPPKNHGGSAGDGVLASTSSLPPRYRSACKGGVLREENFLSEMDDKGKGDFEKS